MRNFRGMKQDEISDIPDLVVVDAGAGGGQRAAGHAGALRAGFALRRVWTRDWSRAGGDTGGDTMLLASLPPARPAARGGGASVGRGWQCGMCCRTAHSWDLSLAVTKRPQQSWKVLHTQEQAGAQL